jgi:hypothetical protein
MMAERMREGAFLPLGEAVPWVAPCEAWLRISSRIMRSLSQNVLLGLEDETLPTRLCHEWSGWEE